MRASLEKLKNSKSPVKRMGYAFVWICGKILPAEKRSRLVGFAKRTLRYRPRYCRKLKGFGLTNEPRKIKIVISLTSYPKRIKTVGNVIVSLLNQTIKPDKVVLWLGEDKFPGKESDLPKKLVDLEKYGLTIAWCKDLRSYTKLIPALKAYPEDIIITVDDDTYYSPNLVERLFASYATDKQCIHSNYVRKIRYGSDGTIAPYRAWWTERSGGSKSHANLLLGYSGVLYPPHVLDDEVLNIEMFQRIAPFADDLWFWAMAVKAGTHICSVSGATSVLEPDFSADQTSALMRENVDGEGLNDKQFKAILEEYPEVKVRLR